VPPGLPCDRCLQSLFQEQQPRARRIQKGIDVAIAKLEKQMGQKLGERRTSAAERAVGREVLHARHDEHHPELGLNDKTTAGLAGKSGNDRFAYDCYRRFSDVREVALDVEMEKFDYIFDARKAKSKRSSIRSHAEDLSDHRRLQEACAEGHRQAVRKIRTNSFDGARCGVP